jgi:uncharacterized Fe-S radical SAM superfamily protein PflX
MVLAAGVTSALILNRKRKEATVPVLIAALKDTTGKYGDARDLTGSNGFNPNYAATSNSPKLDNATYTQAAKDIQNALSRFGVVAGLGTNSTQIFTAIGKAVNQAQLSQITAQYNSAFKSDLLTDLKKDMSSGDYQKLSDQISKLPA